MKEKEKKEPNSTQMMLRLPKDLKDEGMKKAVESGLSFQQVIRKLISDWVKEPQGKLNF